MLCAQCVGERDYFDSMTCMTCMHASQTHTPVSSPGSLLLVPGACETVVLLPERHLYLLVGKECMTVLICSEIM